MTVETQLGRYRLLGEIGRGGMAEVWLASTSGPAGVRKLLVIKRLRQGDEDEPDLVTMFLDEARIALRLAHPNVVQTYEVDVGADGLPFIAMEYLDGQPLHRVLRRLEERGHMSRDLRLWVLAELLKGLHYAHELSDYDGRPLRVVHRDVNPQNVFITYHGQVKLMDFGIAKAMDSVAQTDVGMFKGKLSYMAPEQARGGVELDRRVDIFAVGVMMCEALTNERMWGNRSDIEIATALGEGWVPRVPDDSGIPEPLREICARAIAVDPAERWSSALSMYDALQAWLEAHGEVDNAKLGRTMEESFAVERERRTALVRRYASGTGLFTPSDDSDDGVVEPEAETRRISQPAAAADLLLPMPSPTAAFKARSMDATTESLGRTPTMPTPVASPERWRPSMAVAGLVAVGVSVGLLLGLVAYRFGLWPASEGVSPSEPAPRSPIFDVPLTDARARNPALCVASGPPIEITGELEQDAFLACDRVYLLRYTVRVLPGTTLTIEAGTTILGDSETRGTLVVQPGGRLVAEGRPDAPIVFTSNQPPDERRPGDWGGVLVLGRAPINYRDHQGQPVAGQVEGITRGGRYGGNDPEDDSGVIRYVRIEYSGVELAPNNEINGLTLAGVGRRTRFDHVQVRHTADDCFELFGGTVSGSHLLCDDPGDDGFDWDLGYRGQLSHLVVRMYPGRGQHGVEGDNDPQGDRAEPRSQPLLRNVTMCAERPPEHQGHYGLLLRRGTDARIEQALVFGFDATLAVRDPETTFELVDSILDEPLTPERRAEDTAIDAGALVLAPRWHNRVKPSDGLECGQDGIDGLIPDEPLGVVGEQGAANGRYVGAFRGPQERWDAGWAVWSSRR